MVNGESLTASRHFPYDFEYRFEAGNQARIPKGAVATLVEGGYLTATQSDPMADFILYHPTAEGARYAKHGPKAPDVSQTDWTAA